MPKPKIVAAAVTALAVVLGTAGCGARTADYSSIWTTPGSSTPTSTEAAADSKPVPIAQYLASQGVTGQQVALDKLTDLTVTLPRPAGWTKYANPNFSPGTEAIAKNNSYPTAMVLVFKLDGPFDVPKALAHADADALLSKKFIKLNSSADDFDGFPSSMIEGSYELNGTRVHTYNRIVIPVTPSPAFQRYLVQFTVTSLADQAASQAGDVQQIINGFSVAVK
ncbi:MAG: LpqN/LpqT family lipoprotein [Mycobacterium sp.]